MGEEEVRGSSECPAGTIAWRRTGSGPPLLLINGYAATKDDWDPVFVETLASGSEVVLPDNRGLGDSARGEAELTVQSMAADMVAVLDDLGIERAAVAGWSMGGYVAQSLACLAPDRVEALVLLSTSPGGPGSTLRQAAVHRALTDHSGSPRDRGRRLLDLLFPPTMADTVFEQFGDVVAAAQAELPLDALQDQERAMELWESLPSEQRLGSISAPTLIATGTEDIVIPPENAAALAAGIAGSWLARFPGGGHAFMAQEPARLGGLVNLFLGR